MVIPFNYIITAVEIYLYKSLQINNFKAKLCGVICSSDVNALSYSGLFVVNFIIGAFQLFM